MKPACLQDQQKFKQVDLNLYLEACRTFLKKSMVVQNFKKVEVNEFQHYNFTFSEQYEYCFLLSLA